MHGFNAQELANTVWAFANAGRPDAQLFKALAAVANWHVGNFSAQAIANVAWAVATAGQSDVQLFLALAIAMKLRIGF